MGVACVPVFRIWRAHGVWYRKCDTGKYDHDGDQFGTAEFSYYRHRRSRDVESLDYRNSNGGSGGAVILLGGVKRIGQVAEKLCTVYGAFLYRASAWCSSGEYSGAPICLCFDLRGGVLSVRSDRRRDRKHDYKYEKGCVPRYLFE